MYLVNCHRNTQVCDNPSCSCLTLNLPSGLCSWWTYLTSKGDYFHALISVNAAYLGSFAISSSNNYLLPDNQKPIGFVDQKDEDDE